MPKLLLNEDRKTEELSLRDCLCVCWMGGGGDREGIILSFLFTSRARTFKILGSPGIESKESIPPAYVAWRAGTTTLLLLNS